MMKRLLCLLLSLCLLAGTASAALVFFVPSADMKGALKDDGQLWLAQYDERGKMLDIDTISTLRWDMVVGQWLADAQTAKLFSPADPQIKAQTAVNGAELPLGSSALQREMICAANLQLPMDLCGQDTVTGAELVPILDRFVELEAPNRLAEWQALYPVLREDREPLNRYDVMASLFLAAQFVGGDYQKVQYDSEAYSWSINADWTEHDRPIRWELWGDFDAIPKFDIGMTGTYDTIENLDQCAWYYMLGHYAEVFQSLPFAYDEATNSIRTMARCTYDEAWQAVVRLMASVEPGYSPGAEEDPVAPYLAQADQRRAELRAAVTDHSVYVNQEKKVYYVSNNGDDSNDGLSPETAWATIDKIWEAGILTDDAILFERGGTWYVEPREGQPREWAAISFAEFYAYDDDRDPYNVTIGAYGQGAKPVLRGDIPEANNASFWELYSDADGKRIWKSTQQLTDVPVVVFNEGQAWADPVLPWFNDAGQWINADNTPFTVESGLDRDLTFAWLPELNEGNLLLMKTDNRCGYHVTATVYLRCDAGNPAEVYDVVSLPQTASAVSMNPDCTLYDLDLRYFAGSGAGIGGRGSVSWGQTFHNLEVGWCGGAKGAYGSHQRDGGTVYEPFIAGGGIHTQSKTDVAVTNCYVHHCGPMATILSMHGYEGMSTDQPDLWENHLYAGNLFEACGAPCHWTDLVPMDANTTGFLRNYVFEDNLVMDTGYGWIYEAVTQASGLGGKQGAWLSAVENAYSASDNDGIYIRNNVFCRSAGALLTIRKTNYYDQPVNKAPIFSGNTYIQTLNKPLFQENSWSASLLPLESVMRNVVGDATGTLIILPPK